MYAILKYPNSKTQSTCIENVDVLTDEQLAAGYELMTLEDYGAWKNAEEQVAWRAKKESERKAQYDAVKESEESAKQKSIDNLVSVGWSVENATKFVESN